MNESKFNILIVKYIEMLRKIAFCESKRIFS